MIKIADSLKFIIGVSTGIAQYTSILPTDKKEELRIDPTLLNGCHGVMVSDRDFSRIAWTAFDPKFEAVSINMAVLEKSMIVEERSFMTPPNQEGAANFFYRRSDEESFDEFVAGVVEIIIKYIRNENEKT